MTAEIISIGDEILIGQITNTNSVWMAQQLNLLGIKVTRMSTVADEEDCIHAAFAEAESRSDFVFITGGLGPTKDDVTKKVFANFFNAELVIDRDALADIGAFFSARGRGISELNRQQALVPEGCLVIRNKNGTAPGVWMRKGKAVFISLPGVPHEMMAMMSEDVLPKIRKDNKLPFIYHKTLLTQGLGESAIAEMLEDWENKLREKEIKLAYLPQPGVVRLRLTAMGNDAGEITRNVDVEMEELSRQLAEYVFGYEIYGEETLSLERIVSELLRESKQTLALAESCTGGYISSLFTALPGASDIFRGAIIPYTNAAKHELLDVDESIFETYGAVSQECVEQLALATLKKFNCDYSLAVSGIAGPSGGTSEKPVGTVWVAVANKEKVLAVKFIFGDNRVRNIMMTGQAALNLLRKFIG